jgi:putative flippase GtrA
MKIFVEFLGIDPKYAQLINTVIVVAISYVSQKYFTFRVKDSTG